MRRTVRVALGALAVLASALLIAVGAFLWGLDLDGEFLREELERVLSAAFHVPARIEGPLRLRTGRAATVSADALVLADPLGPAGATLARGVAPRARIDLLALLRRSVVLDEVSGERLELALRRGADGQANWKLLFSRSAKASPVSFAGIGRLRIANVAGSYQREGSPALPFAISTLDGAAPRDAPLTASGSAQIAGQQIAFDLRTDPLAKLKSAADAVPLQGSLRWSGAGATLDGRIVDRGARFEGGFEASADDASAPLAALGITAHEPGALAVRGRLAVTAQQATAHDLIVNLGGSSAAGSASIRWSEPQSRIAVELASSRLDAAPFAAAAPWPQGRRAPEEWVAQLNRLATTIEATVKLAVDEVAGAPLAAKQLRLEASSGAHVLNAKVAAVLAGAPVEATLDYDARKPQHKLAVRVDSGAASTEALPEKARPGELAVSAARISGQLQGQGADPGAIVASLQGDLDARNLGWTLARGSTSISGRFDTVRIALRSAKASSAEVTGRIEGAACTLKVSGGALAPLFAGDPWPLQLAAACPGERFNAKGRIALAERHATADLSFDLGGDRSGPVARAVGLPTELPYPLHASGTLALGKDQAQLRLAAIRLGRTVGTGEIVYPLGVAGTPRLRLTLATLSLDQIGAPGAAEPNRGDPLERRVLPADLRLPDADYDIAADRIELGTARLGGFKLSGSVRAGRLPQAPLRIEFNGMALDGHLTLDFNGNRPRVQLDGSASAADLGPLLAAIGVEDAPVRAEKLSFGAQAQGQRLGELLASATLNATVERARFDLQRSLPPGAVGSGTLSATLEAAPGKPSRLTARGELGGRSVELEAEGPAVDALAGSEQALPLKLRATLGDARIDADGAISRRGDATARVRVEGGRLDQLGDLLGVALPEVQPYAAAASLALSNGAVHFTGLDASFGRSRLTGSLAIERRQVGRSRYSAALHAPVLHLEDVGASRWMRDRASAAPATAAGAPGARTQEQIEHLLDVLRSADLDASIDIDALHGGGTDFASGRMEASAAAGKLKLRLQEVRTQQGRVAVDLGIDSAATPPRFRLRADARGLEYGALLRALNPASKSHGRADLVVDLSAQGRPGNLLPVLQGTIDVATYPVGLRSDALDLWGSGLLQAVLLAVDRDSKATVDCSVAGFVVADGVARSDGFFVDTTNVRIIGDLEIDLGSWQVAGRIDARPHERQLFQISPTMLLRGPLDKPTVSVAPSSLITAPLRFASSLSPFALDWLNRRSRQADGSAGCREAFEQVLQARASKAVGR